MRICTVTAERASNYVHSKYCTWIWISRGRNLYKKTWENSQRTCDRSRIPWRQNQHPITHTVVQYGATVKAKATDYLVFPDGRKFYVQGVDNAGSLNVSMIYYVEERFDIK